MAEKGKNRTVNCTCKGYRKQTGSVLLKTEEKSDFDVAETVTGIDCTCDGKKYTEVSLSFEGDDPSLIAETIKKETDNMIAETKETLDTMRRNFDEMFSSFS